MDERQTEIIPICIREASIKPVDESSTFNFIFVIVLEEGDGACFFIGGILDKETTTLYSHSPCLPDNGLSPSQYRRCRLSLACLSCFECVAGDM